MRQRDRDRPVFTDGTVQVLVAQAAECLESSGLRPIALAVACVHARSPFVGMFDSSCRLLRYRSFAASESSASSMLSIHYE